MLSSLIVISNSHIILSAIELTTFELFGGCRASQGFSNMKILYQTS